MKIKTGLLLVAALSVGATGYADDIERYREAAFKELDMETGSCKAKLEKQRTDLLDDQQHRNQQLESSLESKDAQIAKLQSTVKTLESQLKSTPSPSSSASQKSAESLAKCALYASQLEGKVLTSSERVKDLQYLNEKLMEENKELKNQLAAALSSRNKSVATSAPTPATTVQDQNSITHSDIEFRVRSAKLREGKIRVVLSMVNHSSENIDAVYAGTNPSLIDNDGNLFALANAGQVQGFATCKAYNQITKNLDLCEKQLKQKKIVPTLMEPNVSINSNITFSPEDSGKLNPKTAEMTLSFLLQKGNDIKPITLTINNITIVE